MLTQVSVLGGGSVHTWPKRSCLLSPAVDHSLSIPCVTISEPFLANFPNLLLCLHSQVRASLPTALRQEKQSEKIFGATHGPHLSPVPTLLPSCPMPLVLHLGSLLKSIPLLPPSIEGNHSSNAYFSLGSLL